MKKNRVRKSRDTAPLTHRSLRAGFDSMLSRTALSQVKMQLSLEMCESLQYGLKFKILWIELFNHLKNLLTLYF